MSSTMLLNSELNGVELYFDGKPEEETRENMKLNGFHWNGKKLCWYAKQNQKTLAIAEQITGGAITEFTKESITAITKTAFYPSYNDVDGTKIYKDSNIGFFENGLTIKSGFFADINAEVCIYHGRVKIIDLTNALQVGKTCRELTVCMAENNVSIDCTIANKYKTFKNLYNELFINNNYKEYEQNGVYDYNTSKGINTFSPFVEIKPIKTPKKWTLSHVWKAILSGQIYKGVKDGHYTDDYAYDAAVNFGTGKRLSLPTFASKLIESSSGWWVRVDKEESGIIQLSVNCYSFDCNTLYFDEKCNITEAYKRVEQEGQDKEQHNKNMREKVLNVAKSDIKLNTIYEVTYLEMDDNTGLYSTVTELKYSSGLFYEGDANYQITAITEYIPEDEKMYSISDFYNRPYGEKYNDFRIVDMGNWENIVIGRSLKQLLQEGNRYSTIRPSQEYKTIEQAIEYCKKHINGQMMWMFGEDKTDYKKSLLQLKNQLIKA